MDCQTNAARPLTLAEHQCLAAKEFMYLPMPFVKAMREAKLRFSELLLLQHLWHQGNKNFNAKKTRKVVVSRKRLARVLDYDLRSIGRAISRLAASGWLVVDERYGLSSGSLCNAYEVTIPAQFLAECLAANKRCGTKAQPQTAKQEAQPAANSGAEEAGATNAALLVRYQTLQQALIEQGVSRARAGTRALAEFTEAEKANIHELLTKQVAVKSSLPVAPVSVKQDTDVIPLYQHKLNTIKIVNKGASKLPATNFDADPSQARFAVDEKHKQQLTAKAWQAIHALQAKHCLNEQVLPPGQPLAALVEDAVFHSLHTSNPKVQSPEHALNAALCMIRAGTWRTPKKLKVLRYQQALVRERQALAEKAEFAAGVKRIMAVVTGEGARHV